ncbi:hypothetical protein PoB_001681700 [Plakobranchus ocellatus]|uniref:Uncharacterized protein n=1 Tax=Plakobranchus ocellatus TaxID=259542 RepID=A0AAV3Z724_9GAST|nr:hypothetical protein PoB_001681700 [Plakobranchus ocellatus]
MEQTANMRRRHLVLEDEEIGEEREEEEEEEEEVEEKEKDEEEEEDEEAEEKEQAERGCPVSMLLTAESLLCFENCAYAIAIPIVFTEVRYDHAKVDK